MTYLVFVVGLVILVSQQAEETSVSEIVGSKKSDFFTVFKQIEKTSGKKISEGHSPESTKNNPTSPQSFAKKTVRDSDLATAGVIQNVTKSKLSASSNDTIEESSGKAIIDDSRNLNENIFVTSKFPTELITTTVTKSIIEILSENSQDDLIISSVQFREYRTSQLKEEASLFQQNINQISSTPVKMNKSDSGSNMNISSKTDSFKSNISNNVLKKLEISKESERLSDITLPMFTNVADFISALTPNMNKKYEHDKMTLTNGNKMASVQNTSVAAHFIPSGWNISEHGTKVNFYKNPTFLSSVEMVHPSPVNLNEEQFYILRSRSDIEFQSEIHTPTVLRTHSNDTPTFDNASPHFTTGSFEGKGTKLVDYAIQKIKGEIKIPLKTIFSMKTTANKYVPSITEISSIASAHPNTVSKVSSQISPTSKFIPDTLSFEENIFLNEEADEQNASNFEIFKSHQNNSQNISQVTDKSGNKNVDGLNTVGLPKISFTTNSREKENLNEDVNLVKIGHTDAKEIIPTPNVTNAIQQISGKLASTAISYRTSEKAMESTKPLNPKSPNKDSNMLAFPATRGMSPEFKITEREASGHKPGPTSEMTIIREDSSFKTFSRVGVFLLVAVVVFLFIFGVGLVRSRVNTIWSEEWGFETSAKEPLLRRPRKIPGKFFSKTLFRKNYSSIDLEPRYTHSD